MHVFLVYNTEEAFVLKATLLLDNIYMHEINIAKQMFTFTKKNTWNVQKGGMPGIC